MGRQNVGLWFGSQLSEGASQQLTLVPLAEPFALSRNTLGSNTGASQWVCLVSSLPWSPLVAFVPVPIDACLMSADGRQDEEEVQPQWRSIAWSKCRTNSSQFRRLASLRGYEKGTSLGS